MMYLGPKEMGNFRQRKKLPKGRAYRSDPDHLKFIRSLPSCISGAWPCIAHHLLSVPGTRGTGMKAQDWWTLPLTSEEHEKLHKECTSETEEMWFVRQGIQAHVLARVLWNNSGDHEVGAWAVSKRMWP